MKVQNELAAGLWGDAEDDFKSLTSRIYSELRTDILTCRLRPGERLRIGTLTSRFASSLSAVREALSRLAAEGWLVGRDQRGFTVSSVSVEELLDLFKTRARIECLALGLAIGNADKNWEADVSEAYGRLLRAQGISETYWLREEWVACHNQFHHTLIEGCKSASLIAIAHTLSERSQRYRYLSTTVPSHRDGTEEHRSLFEAVLARDVNRGSETLQLHYETTARILLESNVDLTTDVKG